MIRLSIYSLLILTSTAALAQNQLITRDKTIPCRITSVSRLLIYYVNSYDDKPDSIAAQDVKEIRYGDTLRVFVLPTAEQGKMRWIAPTSFQKAIEQDDFITLLQSRTTFPNLTFTANKTKTIQTLSPTSRSVLTPLATALKNKPNMIMEMYVHTDTVGKVAVNQVLSSQQATSLQSFFVQNRLSKANFIIVAKGESEPVSVKPEENRRLELRCTRVKGIGILYAEKYTPPQKPELAMTKLGTLEPEKPKIEKKYIAPIKRKPLGFLLYAEGAYALESASKSWVDPNQGIGILQGFGAGALVTYYLSSNFGLTFQAGYADWKVQRRYMTEERQVVYTNDQDLQRIGVQVGFRLYAVKSIYLQPMGGGQMLKLTSQNSETHPNGAITTETKKFMPTFGGAVGVEIGKRNIVADIAAQYLITPNTDFSGANGPLHYVGLRAGIGFRSRTH